MGFTTLHFLTRDELTKLKELYQYEYQGTSVRGFLHASHNQNPPEKNKRINEGIRQIITPALDRHFKEYRYYISHFMVKRKSEERTFHLHQDWDVVDEEKYSNLHIWIPLELSGPENGGLFFLPYVHKFVKVPRSGSFGIPSLQPDKKLDSFLVPVRLMPEDAIVYHNAAFHGSYPNPSSADRVAVVVTIVSREAPTIYHHKNTAANTHQIYSLSEEEILTHLPVLEKGGVPPSLRLLSEYPLPQTDTRKISSNYITDVYERNAPRNSFGTHLRPRTKRIIRSDDLEDTINEEGYAVIPFLNADEVNFLLKKFREYFPVYSHLPSRFNSNDNCDSKSRTEIYHIIEQTVKPHTDRLFKNYKMPGAIFYMKQRQKVNDISLHFDPALLLNEHLEPHLGIWCPLVDTNEENGNIQVIPRSHRWGAYITNPMSIHSPLDKYRSLLDERLVSIPLRAGEAVLWDDRIAHSSTINRSQQDRYTITMRFIHENSRQASFLGTPDKRVYVYSQEDGWYLSPLWENKKAPPKTGRLAGVIHHYEPELNPDIINRTLEQPLYGE
ncbi:MAG TPA: phytanoyl-CoA dioxygenase family protein [Chitinophagales bacterium]|nr:phytanoyl-CoA dioxygenase family protein [Chitinophagales bacterium]